LPHSRRQADFAYERLADELRTAIRKREYAPGERLPSETAFAATHGVSRQTVRHVLHKLSSEGIVRTEQGRGTFVQPRDAQFNKQIGSLPDLLALLPESRIERVDGPHVREDATAAERLQLRDRRVVVMTWLRLIEDEPLCIFSTSFPRDLEPAAKAWERAWLASGVGEQTASLVPILDGFLTYPVVEAEQIINAVPAGPREARALHLDEGDPVLEVDRIYLTADSRPVTFTRSYFSSTLYSYRVTLSRNIG
jgi:DNA-binding GntR family transcriptional regulator